jgi:hypothetical protein
MGSGILGTNILAGHGFFGFDPTPNASVVGSLNNLANGSLATATKPRTTTVKTTSGGTPGVLDASTDSGAYTGGSYTGAGSDAALSSAYVDQQLANLNDLLGRTNTGLNQGLQQLGDSYQSNLNTQTNAKNQALQDYTDQRVATNKDKLGAYDTINKNANNAYRSLAQKRSRTQLVKTCLASVVM